MHTRLVACHVQTKCFTNERNIVYAPVGNQAATHLNCEIQCIKIMSELYAYLQPVKSAKYTCKRIVLPFHVTNANFTASSHIIFIAGVVCSSSQKLH